MKKLGNQVLQKIENLLTVIDHPSRQQKKKFGRQKIKKDLINKSVLITPSEKKKQYQNNQALQRIYDQTKSMKNFKVTNPHTIFLNNKNKKKPIYTRTEEILYKREKSIEQLRKQLKKNQIVQEIVMIPIKKCSQKQIDQKLQLMLYRYRQTINKFNLQKLNQMQENQKRFKQKPNLSKSSLNKWKEKKLKKNLSSNILRRFQQYDWQKQSNWEQYLKKNRLQQTPFTPKISPNSRTMVNKSRSKGRLSLIDRLTSVKNQQICKCLKKKPSFTYGNLTSTRINSSRNLRNSLSCNKIIYH